MSARGSYLETQVARLLGRLGELGVHGHKNHARRLIDGTFVSGEPFDYEIFANGRLIAFDAKECKGRRWALSNAKLSQINELKKLKNHGAEAFFLVLFVPNRLVVFDVDQIIEARGKDIKSLTAEEGREFEWQTLLRSNEKQPV